MQQSHERMTEPPSRKAGWPQPNTMHGKDNKKSLASKSQFQSKGFSRGSVPFKATGYKGGISRQGSKRG